MFSLGLRFDSKLLLLHGFSGNALTPGCAKDILTPEGRGDFVGQKTTEIFRPDNTT